MKKWICALLTAAVALSACLSVWGAEMEAAAPAERLLPLVMYGYISDEGENRIEVYNAQNPEDILILNLSEETFILDAVTGQAATIAERQTDRVAVYYGPMTTRSLPPQSPAVAIAVNLPEDSFSPHYAVVESVETVENGVKVLTDNGGIYVTITQDAPLMPYLTRNIVTVDHLRVGSELMLWYDMVAMSYPGQAASTQTVLLRNPNPETGTPEISATEDVPEGENPVALEEPETAAIPAESGDGTITLAETADSLHVALDAGIAEVNGQDIALETVRYSDDGTPMLPIRQLCEALGYHITWMAETKSATLTKENSQIGVANLHPVYDFDGEAVTLAHAPFIDSGTMYAPLGFFERIPGLRVIATDSGN